MRVVFGLGVTELLFGAGAAILLLLLVGWITHAIAETLSNKKQPIVSIPVRVVAKRTLVQGGSGNFAASTSYYVTFEHANGLREEVSVSGEEYGMIAERDRGTLSYQGTWFKGFERTLPGQQ